MSEVENGVGRLDMARLTDTPVWRVIAAVAVAMGCTAALIALAGADPIAAYRAMALGAFGSLDRLAFGLNKATPYILCGVGVSLCLRAKVMNIGGEGQIALGGLCAAWVALKWPVTDPVLAVLSASVGGIAGGMAWAGLAALIHLTRGVNEVLVTLLMNFVALLLVEEALHGSLGEPGAGFPQSPQLEPAYWLPKLIPSSELHFGILVAVGAAVLAHILLWRTSWGFKLRIFGESRTAAVYAGVSPARTVFGVMTLAGGLAGLAGAIEVLGIHYRLIDGFSKGFGFNAIAVALVGALNPLAIIPAALFFGFLEAGTLAMQRQAGIPSSLVVVTQGLTILFVLAAAASARRKSSG